MLDQEHQEVGYDIFQPLFLLSLAFQTSSLHYLQYQWFLDNTDLLIPN